MHSQKKMLRNLDLENCIWVAFVNRIRKENSSNHICQHTAHTQTHTHSLMRCDLERKNAIECGFPRFTTFTPAFILRVAAVIVVRSTYQAPFSVSRRFFFRSSLYYYYYCIFILGSHFTAFNFVFTILRFSIILFPCNAFHQQ